MPQKPAGPLVVTQIGAEAGGRGASRGSRFGRDQIHETLVEHSAQFSRERDAADKRLAAVQKIGNGETAVEQRPTAAAVNRPLAKT